MQAKHDALGGEQPQLSACITVYYVWVRVAGPREWSEWHAPFSEGDSWVATTLVATRSSVAVACAEE